MCVSASAVCVTPLHVCAERGAEAWLGERGGPGGIRAEASSVRCHGGFGGVVARMGKLHGAWGGSVMRGFFFSGEEGVGDTRYVCTVQARRCKLSLPWFTPSALNFGGQWEWLGNNISPLIPSGARVEVSKSQTAVSGLETPLS